MLNEPLGLPKGSIRAILTLVIVVGVLIALFTVKGEIVDKLTPIASMVFGYYFGSRGANKENSNG